MTASFICDEEFLLALICTLTINHLNVDTCFIHLVLQQVTLDLWSMTYNLFVQPSGAKSTKMPLPVRLISNDKYCYSNKYQFVINPVILVVNL